MALPLLLVEATPQIVALVGLTAIVGAVTSSFSASILSAGSMISWNLCRGLMVPNLSARSMRRLVRVSVVALGALAAVLALRVQSVQQLWFFTSDLVFVLVFPQLLYALFDPRANRTGSVAAFCVSLVLRLGEGEPILALPALFPYVEVLGKLLPEWLWFGTAVDVTLFPIRTVSAAVGLVLLPAVSRMTARWDPPRAMPQPPRRGDVAPGSQLG
jgi:high affinity choline transporter 7